ncbi:hypothetical protein Purlil1_13023 [Purpureocillium lilacinum]|uniref:Uncharacterized protein n=1 Tax=Purpureocillium lilacinum TaxID=33203 RepID=A0ABR0BF70_PURLI|nr:hypothetical protein Purlil1_13023 [Purpureocillium lilacinum]
MAVGNCAFNILLKTTVAMATNRARPDLSESPMYKSAKRAVASYSRFVTLTVTRSRQTHTRTILLGGTRNGNGATTPAAETALTQQTSAASSQMSDDKVAILVGVLLGSLRAMMRGNPVDMALSAVDLGRLDHLALPVLGANPGPLAHEGLQGSGAVKGIKDPRVILDEMDGTDERAMMGVMAGMGVLETTDGMVEMAARDRMAFVAHPVPRVLKENRDVKVTLASPESKVPQVLKGHPASRALLEIRVQQERRGSKAGTIHGGKLF